jgi:hypothetical protein
MSVQVAKARGAEVTATASAARRDFVLSLGADAFVDYSQTPADRWPAGFDTVIDCVPNLPRHSHGRLVARDGRYVSTLPGAATYLLDPLLNRIGRLKRYAVMLAPSAAPTRSCMRTCAVVNSAAKSRRSFRWSKPPRPSSGRARAACGASSSSGSLEVSDRVSGVCLDVRQRVSQRSEDDSHGDYEAGENAAAERSSLVAGHGLILRCVRGEATPDH